MKGTPVAVGLVVLAVIFLVIAGLYYQGILQIAVSDTGAPHHEKHAILFGVLAIAALVGANFARPKHA